MRGWVTLGLAIGLAGLFGFADRTMRADLERASTGQAVRAARAEANWFALLLEQRLDERARALEVIAEGTSEGATALALRLRKAGVSARAWVEALRSQFGPWIEVALVDEAGVVQEASSGGAALGRPKVVTVALEGRATVGLHRFGTVLALVAASPVPGKRVPRGAVVVSVPLDAGTLRRWIPNLPAGCGLALIDDRGLVAHTLAGNADWPSKLGLTEDDRYVSQRTSRFGSLRVQTVAPLAPPGRSSMGELASVRLLLLGVLAFLVCASVVWMAASAPAGGRGSRRGAKNVDLLSMPLNVPPIPVPDLAPTKSPAVQPLPAHPPPGSASRLGATGGSGGLAGREPVTPVQDAPNVPVGERAETPPVGDPHAQTTMPSIQAPRPPLPDIEAAKLESSTSSAGASARYGGAIVRPATAPSTGGSARYGGAVVRPAIASTDGHAKDVPHRETASERSGTEDLIAQIPAPPERPPAPPRPPPSSPPHPRSDSFDAIASAARARPKSSSTAGLSVADDRARDGHLGPRSWMGAPGADPPAAATSSPELRSRSPDLGLPDPRDAPLRADGSGGSESPENVPLPAPVGYRADLLAPKDMSAVPLPPPSSVSSRDLWPSQSVPPGPAVSSPSAETVVPGPPNARSTTGSLRVPKSPPPSSNGGISTPRLAEPPASKFRPERESGPPVSVSESGPAPFDEAHYRGVYDRFVQAKTELGQSLSSVSWEAFRSKLRSSEQTLLDQHGCRAVRFQVLVRERTVSLRPQLIR